MTKYVLYEITRHLLFSKHIQRFALPTLNFPQKDRENKYVIRTLLEGNKANQTKYIIWQNTFFEFFWKKNFPKKIFDFFWKKISEKNFWVFLKKKIFGKKFLTFFGKKISEKNFWVFLKKKFSEKKFWI